MPDPTRSSRPWLSIILPCWGDRDLVAERIEDIQSFTHLGNAVEFIVADATPDAQSPPPDLPQTKWIADLPAGRGGQLRTGGKNAKGEVFLFHHADNELTSEHLRSLEMAMEDSSVQAGAFHRNHTANWPIIGGMEAIARWWSKHFGFLYGDQSVFVRQELYQRLGGISPLPLMEDVEFSDRLRRATQPVLLDPPLEASMRRFRKKGAFRNKLGNLRLIALYRLGVSPSRLYEIYYG